MVVGIWIQISNKISLFVSFGFAWFCILKNMLIRNLGFFRTISASGFWAEFSPLDDPAINFSPQVRRTGIKVN